MLDNLKTRTAETSPRLEPPLDLPEIIGIVVGRIAAKITLAIIPTCVRKKLSEWIDRSIEKRWGGQA